MCADVLLFDDDDYYNPTPKKHAWDTRSVIYNFSDIRENTDVIL